MTFFLFGQDQNLRPGFFGVLEIFNKQGPAPHRHRHVGTLIKAINPTT